MNAKRRYFNSLIKEAENPFVSILIGPRQVGKSFLLEELNSSCRKMGKSTAFYNLEFPDDLLAFSRPEAEIIAMLLNGPDVIFIEVIIIFEQSA